MSTNKTVIYKYEIPLQDRSVIQLPKGSKILSVGLQKKPDNPSYGIYLWASVPLEALKSSDMEDRHIRIIGTGQHSSIAEPYFFLGTVYDEIGCFVWHVFEEQIKPIEPELTI